MRFLSGSLFALCAVFLLDASAGQGAEKPPNIVLIVSDDQCWTDFGFMGNETIRTPHLDRLAAQSVVFTHGYVPMSVCRPSFATLVSGQYPHEHGITINDPPPGVERNEMLRFVRRMSLFPKILTERGYVSLQTGKWWEGHWKNGGFTSGMTHGDPERGGRDGDEGLVIGRQTLDPIFRFIDDAGDKPFLVWYAPHMPHAPYNPPERLLRKYAAEGKPRSVASYEAMCEWFDETCGELLNHLDEKGLSENTLVLFMVDNGRVPSERGGPAPRSKGTPYDAGIRTPILVRWPQRLKPARHDVPVSSLDLSVTIVAAAGGRPDSRMRGIDLVKVAEAGGKSDRAAVFGAIFDTKPAALVEPSENVIHRWCVAGKWKLILPIDPNRSAELYDLAADPRERNDLAGSEPERTAAMRRRVDAWWTPTAKKE